MQTYSDEYIEHWADIYLVNEVSKRNVCFIAFLQGPQDILDAITSTEALQDSLDELDSLLPIDAAEVMQEEMEKHFERKGHVVEMHGNKNIERFTHHDPAKKWKTNTRSKSGSAS